MAEDNSNNNNITAIDQNFAGVKKSITIVLESAQKKESTKFDNGDDIVKETLVQFAEFAAVETRTAGNQYPLISPRGNLNITTTKTFNGSPGSLVDPGQNGQTNYIDNVAENAKANFNKTSKSGMLDTDQDGNFVIKKGKQESLAPSGDDLYKDININKGSSLFSKRVQNVLFENTGLNQDNPFIKDPGNTNENDLKLATIKYNTLGEYGPKKFPNTTTDVGDNNRVTIGQMKRLGVLTLLGAAGDILPEFPADQSDDAVFSAVSRLSAKAPGLARLGTKISTERFETTNLIKTMNPKFAGANNTNFLDNGYNLSYGNTNTPFAQFAGVDPSASIISAGILIGVVSGLVFSVSKLKFKNSDKNISGPHNPDAKQSYLGSSDGTAQNFEKPLLDTPKLKNDFFVCVEEGMKVFFAFDYGPNATGGIGQTSKNLSKMHGYYNIILRQIVRGISDLTINIGSGFGLGKGKDFNVKADEIFDNIDPFVISERLKSLPIVKFINTLAMIGDKSIQSNGVVNENMISIYDIIDNELIRENENSIDPGILITKQTLKSKNNRSAIAASNKRSLLAMPIDFESSKILGDTTANPKRSAATLGLNNKIILENRISSEEVRKFEDYLEKDYMPFYFQDLRTNEILSFHAFLGEINESLSADYVENEGYGRMGTVPIYKNTKRTINFSFYIISTNTDDFDEMWYKINRIGSMLFPQWSEGRKINSNGNKFTQPFSQVIAASPLIRFRIGDLWKSNYSKFALAKLFGLSSDYRNFNIRNTQQTQSTSTREQTERQTRINERARTIAQRRSNSSLSIAERYMVGEKIRVDVSSLPRSPGASTGLYKVVDTPTTATNSLNLRQNQNNFRNLAAGASPGSIIASYSTTEWLVPEEETVLTVERAIQQNRETGYLVCRTTNNGSNGARTRTLNRERSRTTVNLEPTNSGEAFIVPLNSIRANDPVIIQEQAVRELFNETTNDSENTLANQQNSNNNIQQFFSDTDGSATSGNPIMKAFKSTEGRGIAGFIKQLTPDYSQATWETEKFGGRAPKIVKLTIEFLPIWDIAPGLDHNGAMTAPIWNVGQTINDYHGGRGLEKSAAISYKNSKVKIPRY